MGELVDTNSPYLAAKLPPMGIELQQVTQARDDIGVLIQAFKQAFERSDLVLTTGGLGPTDDDLTREAIAGLLGEILQVDSQSLDHLQDSFRQRGATMPSVNVKQAYLIPSARSIINTMGTAPGWWVEHQRKIIVAMPGPPLELQRMWEGQVQSQLSNLTSGAVILTRSFKTHGLGESALNELIAPLFQLQSAELGMYAEPQGVQVRVRVRAQNNEDANELIYPVEAELRRYLGRYIWGVDDQTIEEEVGKELKRQGLTLAVMESCTGGLLAHSITQVPGSSNYFRGGIVAYSDDMKVNFGVGSSVVREYGAVSPQVAQDMARAVKHLFGADIGVGITGVAGPEELEGNPVGTVHVGLAHNGNLRHFSYLYPPHRSSVKQRASMQALLELSNLLRQLDEGNGCD